MHWPGWKRWSVAPLETSAIVTEVVTPTGKLYKLPGGELLPLPEVYSYMRLHGQGILLIDDLPEMPKKGGKKNG